MAYRHEVQSVEALVQYLAANLLPHGYWFYVTGLVPPNKDPSAIDAKLVAKYGAHLSRQQRARRKLAGLANVHYLRCGRWWVLLATHGKHRLKADDGSDKLPPVKLLPTNSERLELPIASPTESRVAAFLAKVFPAISGEQGMPDAASALVPWACDVLQSEHSIKGYGRDLAHFLSHMHQMGIEPFEVRGDHVRIYKASLLKAGMKATTVARRLSVLRGVYKQFAIKGLVAWDTWQDLAAVTAPPVAKNTTPALTSKQAIALLEAIPNDTLQGIRDLALLQTFFITGCRVSAIINACVGHLEFDGVEHYLHVTEKRNKKARKILLDAARALLSYMEVAGIQGETDVVRETTVD